MTNMSNYKLLDIIYINIKILINKIKRVINIIDI